jgi:hypothetical protein
MPGSAPRGASRPSVASMRLRLPCRQRPLYGPIDELPCPLVSCLGSRFALLDDVGLIPLEIPNPAAGAAHFVFRRRVVIQRGWHHSAPSTFGVGIRVDLKARTGVLPHGRQWQIFVRASRGRKSSGSSSGVGLIQSRQQTGIVRW